MQRDTADIDEQNSTTQTTVGQWGRIRPDPVEEFAGLREGDAVSVSFDPLVGTAVGEGREELMVTLLEAPPRAEDCGRDSPRPHGPVADLAVAVHGSHPTDPHRLGATVGFVRGRSGKLRTMLWEHDLSIEDFERGRVDGEPDQLTGVHLRVERVKKDGQDEWEQR